MTLHGSDYQIGVRDLHDRLSEHLGRVESGSEVLVTRRGTPIARLCPVEGTDPLDELVRRGLVTPPPAARRGRRTPLKAKAPVSELVAEQRR